MSDRGGWRTALRIAPLAPLAVAVLMFFVTPTYFRPMLGGVLGLVMVAIAVASIGIGYGLAELAIWLLRMRRVAVSVPVLAGYAISELVALFMVLLGPSMLILSRP